MIYLILRKTGLKINHKRVERVYATNKMQLKLRKTRKKFKVEKRADHLLSSVPGKWLAVDFVIDSIGNKRQLKMLTAIDPVTNESPLIQPAFSMRGEQVAEVLDRKCSECGYLEFLPDNCFIESFNGTLRNECLNVYYFPNISEAKRIIEEWRIDYNKKRPQKRFKGLTPFEYRNKILAENLI
jgi:putative transposase